MSGFERVTLKNGTRAIRHLASGEVMHPAVGPWAEANRLYVEQTRLRERLSAPGPTLRIWDVGLGAATNAVAALEAARALGEARRRPLEVVSFERDLEPLRLALEDPEGFPFLTGWREEAEALLRGGTVDRDGLAWRLREGELFDALPTAPTPVELVYYDPFSPRANPELWTVAAFERLRAATGEGETLVVTYSASTRTRVSLLLAGFFVGAGMAIGAKRETTLAATRLALLEHPLDRAWLERWRRSSAQAPHGEPGGAGLEARLLAHPQLAGGEEPISTRGG